MSLSDYEPKCKKTLPIIFDDRMPGSNLTPKLVSRVNDNTEDLKNLYEETETIQGDIETLQEDVDDKLDIPETAGTAGQVLTSDGEGGAVWASVGSGEIVVDPTLTVEGAAADAKKTGDEITHLKQDLNDLDVATELFTGVEFRNNKFVNQVGYEGTNNDYALSFLYECDFAERVYTSYNQNYTIAYYDEDKTFLSMQDVTNVGRITGWLRLDPPAGAVYFKFNIYKPDLSPENAKIEYKHRLKFLNEKIENVNESVSLYTGISYTDGKYVNNSGYIGSNANYALSELYRCDEYSAVYTGYVQDYTIAYYANDKTTFKGMKYVQNLASTVGWLAVDDIPADAVYFRFNIIKSSLDPSNARMKYRYTSKWLNNKIDNLPFVTPQMFGAVGDGTHDDTTAIQAAIDTEKRVILPKGVYAISSPLVISMQGTVIEGEENIGWSNGTKAIIRVKSGVSSLSAFIKLDDDSKNFMLKNVLLTGDSNCIPEYGIVWNNDGWVTDMRLENVFITYCSCAIYLKGVFKSVFTNVRAQNCVEYGFRLTGKTSVTGTTITMINCYADNCNRSFTFDMISYSSLINCASDNCTNYDYSAVKCSGISYINCGCEQSKGNPFYFTGSSYGITIIGFICAVMQTLTSGLDDAFISCHGMMNCSFSGIHINSTIQREYDIYNKATIDVDSITVLDDSLSPAKCYNLSGRRIVFSRRMVIDNIINTPDFAGQLAVTASGVYAALTASEWTQLQ